MTCIWRINIKTAAQDGIDPRKFCIERNIAGIGWGVESKFDGYEEYIKLAEKKYYYIEKRDKGWWPAINSLSNRMQNNDLCWTRDVNGIYYIGRINGEWEPRNTKDCIDADIRNIRQCFWCKVGEADKVPGKVLNSFRPARVLQKVNGESVKIYTMLLYNKLSDDYEYKFTKISFDLFSLLSPEDCEDLVGLYLQERGYRLFPSSKRRDTMGIEFVLKHTETGKKAVVQVKQGESPILIIDDYFERADEVYLFSTEGNYIGEPKPNVHCIAPQEILRFVRDKEHILPDRIKFWIELTEKPQKEQI